MLEVLLRTERARIEDRLLSRGEPLPRSATSSMWKWPRSLRRYAAAGHLTSNRGFQALTDLADFPIHRYSHGVQLPHIWALSPQRDVLRRGVALAEALPRSRSSTCGTGGSPRRP